MCGVAAENNENDVVCCGVCLVPRTLDEYQERQYYGFFMCCCCEKVALKGNSGRKVSHHRKRELMNERVSDHDDAIADLEKRFVVT